MSTNPRCTGAIESNGYRRARPHFPADQHHPVLSEDINLKSRNFLTPLLAANAVVFIAGRTGDFHIVAVNRTDRRLLWDVKLPAQPMFGGLSLTRAGDVLTPLVDGRVACIGTEKGLHEIDLTGLKSPIK